MAEPISRVDTLASIAAFYDHRVACSQDLNRRAAGSRPAIHHSGFLFPTDRIPSNGADALTFLYKAEQRLDDYVWRLIRKHLGSTPLAVLDVGCGEGATLLRFCELAHPCPPRLVGITGSAAQAARARVALPQATWVVGDARKDLSSYGQQFDAAVAIESTEYFGRAGLEAFEGIAARVLRPGGVLVVVAGSVRDPDKAQRARLAFNEHYRTDLQSTAQYQSLCAGYFLKCDEFDLASMVEPYWRARSSLSHLQNSPHGSIEETILQVLECGIADFRAYVWKRL